MFRRPMGKAFASLTVAALLLVHHAASAQEPSSMGWGGGGASYSGGATLGAPGCAGCSSGTCGAPACSTCAPRCQMFHCPHQLKWCSEGPPRICFRCGCPKPICCPCEAPNWGYFQKCWTKYLPKKTRPTTSRITPSQENTRATRRALNPDFGSGFPDGNAIAPGRRCAP